ncbi:MAG: TonB-dependent receptor [Rhodocyclaceae bacterium]|nr:TonB-dependent receptor [Rhodocyclaceae bacterium]
MPTHTHRPHLLALSLLAAPLGAHGQASTTLPTVEVVDTTPLPGLGIERDRIPANVQQLKGDALTGHGALNPVDAMQRTLPGLHINNLQNNPYQADINYRGFTVSPLLGTPQGLSVFVDGVRVNEGFGDVVNWDLIPQSAIADLTVSPGSNPLFGLNTLGGAMSLTTKDGRRHPGTTAEASTGSFGRTRLGLNHGGSTPTLSWFLAAERMDENGWRDYSPSEVGQLFGKFGWQGEASRLTLTASHAETDLTGNGLLPESMYAADRNAVFTHPDNTRNRLQQLALTGEHWLGDADQLGASVYWRKVGTRTLNGDGNDEYDNAPDPSGVLNRTRTDQIALGGGLQWTRYGERHQLTLGASHDRSRAAFRQSEQEGSLTATRGVSPEEDEELANHLDGRTRTTSLFVSDTVALTPTLHLSASARYNHTRVINVDRLDPTPPNLDGDFTYERVNPALGLSWQLRPTLTLYGGYNEGNRAPTPIELGCADPANPCTLPNALAADPYLAQVVSRTVEFGVRGMADNRTRWSAGVFRSTNTNDILFVGTSTSAGYFTNFGKTRRQGLELAASRRHGAVDWQLSYTWLDATFQDRACLVAENNSSAEADPSCGDDQIRVSPGDRLPLQPRHSLKLGLDWHASDALRVGANLQAFSGQTLRGNENGQHVASSSLTGQGRIGGYAVINLDADYALGKGLTLVGRIDNLFDKRYASGGALAENPFDAAGQFQSDEDDWVGAQFIAPGAPRAVWIGLRYHFDG